MSKRKYFATKRKYQKTFQHAEGMPKWATIGTKFEKNLCSLFRFARAFIYFHFYILCVCMTLSFCSPQTSIHREREFLMVAEANMRAGHDSIMRNSFNLVLYTNYRCLCAQSEVFALHKTLTHRTRCEFASEFGIKENRERKRR